MNPSPTNIVEISSDSSSDSSSGGWKGYFPPNYTSTSRNKNSKKKVETTSSDEPSTDELPPYVDDSSFSSDSSDDDDLQVLSVLLTKEFEKAASSVRMIPVPEKKQNPKPRIVVLGLPCKQVTDAIGGRGVHKTMPDCQGKGKRKME